MKGHETETDSDMTPCSTTMTTSVRRHGPALSPGRRSVSIGNGCRGIRFEVLGRKELAMFARREALKAIAAVAGIVAVPAAVRAQTLDTVNCGKLVGVSDAAFYIADKKGFFREAGISVNWTTFPQSQAMVAPLAAGQLDA